MFFGVGYGAYFSTVDMPILMVAWTVTWIAMKGYILTVEKMKDIQAANARHKEAIATGMSLEEFMAHGRVRRIWRSKEGVLAMT